MYKNEEYKGYDIKFVKCGLVGEYRLFYNEVRVGTYNFYSLKEAKTRIDKEIISGELSDRTK